MEGRADRQHCYSNATSCMCSSVSTMRLWYRPAGLQGEVEIKDADEAASNVHIEIEKTGPSELQTDGVTVNHTLFDVGHGTIFVLQLVRTATAAFTTSCGIVLVKCAAVQHRREYDTIKEFNVDPKAECGQLNLAQENDCKCETNILCAIRMNPSYSRAVCISAAFDGVWHIQN